MLIDEATLRPGLFRVPDDRVSSNILIPGFRAATSVRGAFGWFTSGWIGRLAPGLAEYLNRENAAPIVFTVAPALFSAERSAAERAIAMTEDEAAQLVAGVFIAGRAQASALARHALDCLAWMIATNRLQLRIAVPTPTSNYHPKIWLFADGQDHVLARGSGNATAHGVAEGVEHLDVDVSWLPDSQPRVAEGVAILDDWSRGHSLGIERVIDLPDALAQNIIETAPDTAPHPANYSRARALEARLRPLPRTPARPISRRLQIPESMVWRTGTYAHQGEAVSAWEGGPHPERGIVAMATGAGKTIAALLCATRAQNRLDDAPFLVVVSAPSIPLIVQWRSEVENFGIKPIVPSLERNTDEALTRLARGLSGGGTHLAIVTNNLLCTPAFQSTVSHMIGGSREPVPTMLIADEAHTLGADSFLENKPEFFVRRIGLSATPERQYDPDGTEEILAFFGGAVYEFGLDRAIGFCLVPYDYYVHAGTLDDVESEEFERLSQRIGAAIGSGETLHDSGLARLLIARRRILETATGKLALLRAVLDRRGPRQLTQTLIYASAKNPAQFDDIASILTELNIKWAPVTQQTTANRGKLERTLKTFADGACQVLLAKKVLDEGVDIPSVREAFIIASSMVEREWIQRRGRVLRRHPDKPWAVVHDFLALPPVLLVRNDRTVSLTRIVQTELNRAYSFASYARNAPGANGVIAHLQRIRAAYWPTDESTPHILCNADDYVVAPSTPKGNAW